MAQDDSFDALMARLRSGDEAAATEVFQHFAGRLVALARSRLQDALAGKEDPEDVLQSVLRSFFTRYREGQFDVRDWDNLWGVLTVLTLRKCGSRFEYYHADRRDIHREVRLRLSEDSQSGWDALVRDPTPSQVAVLTETVEHLMRGMEHRDREILALHLQGYTLAEVSERIGRAQRTVQRTLERVRKRLQRLQEADAAS